MARPGKVAPGQVTVTEPESLRISQLPSGSPAADYVDVSVTGAWDNLRNTLGRTVPYNVNQAQASARRLRTGR